MDPFPPSPNNSAHHSTLSSGVTSLWKSSITVRIQQEGDGTVSVVTGRISKGTSDKGVSRVLGNQKWFKRTVAGSTVTIPEATKGQGREG